MPLTSLMPFAEALEALRRKKLLPTSLSSAQMRAQFSSAMMRGSMTSARTVIEELLDGYKTEIDAILNPVTVRREDRISPENPEGFVTQGSDVATARMRIKELLRQLEYQPEEGKAGTIEDLSSSKRINLVLKTNLEIVRGTGNFLKGQDASILEAFPCKELIRLEARKVHRDWPSIWMSAAHAVGDTDAARVFVETGRMVARKDSPIWQQLGDSEDGLGNPFAPYRFGSGMGDMDVSYDDAAELGLVDLNTKIEPQTLDFETLFGDDEEEAA